MSRWVKVSTVGQFKGKVMVYRNGAKPIAISDYLMVTSRLRISVLMKRPRYLTERLIMEK